MSAASSSAVSATRPLSAIVLAAGEGTRMRSDRPKPLHLLCGKAMLVYVLDSLLDCSMRRAVVVVGHGAERVTKKLQEHEPDLVLDFVEQHVQRGTGDAVSVGLTAFPDDETAFTKSPVLITQGKSWVKGVGMQVNNRMQTYVIESQAVGFMESKQTRKKNS